MEPLSIWENLLLGAMALLVIFWMKPGVKTALERSKNTPSDWPAALIPLAVVVLFVLLLIGVVKS